MITSTKNKRIVELRKLSQRKHRRRQNSFVVEGLQLLGMALEAAALPGWAEKIIPQEVFYSEELFTGDMAAHLLDQLRQAGATLTPVAPSVLDSLSERETSQGLLATFALSEMAWSLAELRSVLALPPPKLVIVLDRLQDPGNLGTLIRTADAVGAAAVILLEPCVDLFDPKTVRGSMGSLFNLPVSHIETDGPGSLFTTLSDWGYRPVGADGRRGVMPWERDVLGGPVALVLGNEARGLSPDLEPHLSDYVGLPMRGGAESLNVAVAGGVLMYEWLRLNG